MVFSSSTFLLVFLPIVLFLYFVIPPRWAKNILLLMVSLVFYAWGEPVYVLLMIVSIAFNWLFAVLIHRSERHRKLYLVLAVAANLSILGFYKYESFLASIVNDLLGAPVVPDLSLPLPIGISFYTLQALSYVIDVYRKTTPYQRNPFYLGMYIALFPQLIAGPIVRYSTIQDQIEHRRETLEKFVSGFRLFAIGLAKKVLLANVVAILATKMLELGGAQIGAIGAWAGLIAFTFQIFFDFSGYSDMAIGLGKMFGFEYLRNFNYPYISKSVTEFWRRWHISLSSFFRDYLYIPLGGNRVSRSRWVFNLMVVWFLTGFWHGAAWNYIFWGLYYGAILIVEKLWLGRALDRLPAVVGHLYTIVVFLFGWYFFWIEDVGMLAEYGKALLGCYGASGTLSLFELTAWEYWPVFVVCALASTPLVPYLRFALFNWVTQEHRGGFLANDIANAKYLEVAELCNPTPWLERAESSGASQKRLIVFRCVYFLADIACLALVLLSVFSVVSGSFNPFIYFRF